MAEHTITSVNWKNLGLEEVLVVIRAAHTSRLPDVTTWTREGDVQVVGGPMLYAVDTDNIDVATIGKIEQALSEYREERERVAAQLVDGRG